jgi:TRAP-type mannitol/chloroaromatic compound transport system permease small subunit
MAGGIAILLLIIILLVVSGIALALYGYLTATAATAFAFAPWYLYMARFFTGAGIAASTRRSTPRSTR